MQNNQPHLIPVPGTEKMVNLQELFKLIENDYPDHLDKIDGMAQNIDSVIRYLSGTISNETDHEELRTIFYILYRLRDVFGGMEVKK